MIINDRSHFVPMIIKLLTGLGYENVSECEKENIDITATKAGEKYCFRCRYDIDAIGEKYINDFSKAAKAGGYDKAVFVTNSSFISAAKKRGDADGILLWDRNTIDRLSIGVPMSIQDRPVAKKKKKGLAIIIALAVVAIAIIGFEYWYFFIK